MLGWRPSAAYKYLWKYICQLAMLVLLAATTVHMFIEPPTYRMWKKEMVRSLMALAPPPLRQNLVLKPVEIDDTI